MEIHADKKEGWEPEVRNDKNIFSIETRGDETRREMPDSPKSDSSLDEDNKLESVKMKTKKGGKFYCARSIFNVTYSTIGLIIILLMVFVLILVYPDSPHIDKYLYLVFFVAGSFASKMKETVAKAKSKNAVNK